ncbi:MAG: hypothetical protein IPI67_31185 [Myxococcales bacterium]|nr:hypothetical protein [Myxococcales bacterium]
MDVNTFGRWSLVCFFALAPMACGGSTSEDSAAGGSSGTGGSSGSGGAGGAGGSGGIAGTGGSGGGGAGGGSCADFADDVAPDTITIRFQNARATPIYMGGDSNCSPDPLFDLEGPSGSVQLLASGCGNTCEKLQQQGDWCPDACLLPPVVVINPGGSYDKAWDGTSFVPEKMPTSCYFEPKYAPPLCDRKIVAPAGAYGAIATAATAIACTDLGICPCVPNANGSCEIPYGAAIAGETITAKTSFDMPSAKLVVITFQ